MPGPNLNKDEVVNSLRLNDKEAEEILTALSRLGTEPPDKERRRQERLPYKQRAGLIVKMHHLGGSIENYLVRVRNLSTGGIGFLHGSFVYSGTRCTLILRSRDNRSVSMEGTVVRCKHIRKHIHEVGLRFATPIQTADFVASALRMGSDAETSRQLPQLSGQVMCVEDSISDQELISFHLASVGVKVRAVSDVLTAVEMASQIKFDAVLTNVWMPTMSGLELADFLRQSGYTGPIIAMTPDTRPELQDDAAKHGCNAVLIKPYHFEELYSVLEPYLKHANPFGSGDTMMSELWADERMQPLIRSFLKRLKDQILEMERLIEGGRINLGLRKLCMEIKGTAGGYGFPRISDAAQALLDVLTEDTNGLNMKTAFSELAARARSACATIENEAASGDSPPADATAA